MAPPDSESGDSSPKVLIPLILNSDVPKRNLPPRLPPPSLLTRPDYEPWQQPQQNVPLQHMPRFQPPQFQIRPQMPYPPQHHVDYLHQGVQNVHNAQSVQNAQGVHNGQNFQSFVPVPVPQYPMAQVPNYAYQYGSQVVVSASGPMQPQNKHRRFRRRYYQIHRKYNCTFTGCTKGYGLLNHLNTHIVTKKHGVRKLKADFKHEKEAEHRDEIRDETRDDFRDDEVSSSTTTPLTEAPESEKNAKYAPADLESPRAYKLDPENAGTAESTEGTENSNGAQDKLDRIVLPPPKWSSPTNPKAGFSLPSISAAAAQNGRVKLPLLPLVVGQSPKD